MPQLKPFSEYTVSDWTDIPVQDCKCLYCKAYPVFHPDWEAPWALPPSHSGAVAEDFGGTTWHTTKKQKVSEEIISSNTLSITLDEAKFIVGNKKSKPLQTGGLDFIRASGMKFIYLIRGIPGSGKSTLSALLKSMIQRCGWNSFHFEADDFFTNQVTGEYLFVPEKLAEAHSQCQINVEDVMEHERGVVIVSNTFVYRAHLEPYLKMAKKHGYTPIEIICRGNFQNIHEVPPETLRKMKLNFEI